jgi:hypothetical protein
MTLQNVERSTEPEEKFELPSRPSLRKHRAAHDTGDDIDRLLAGRG